MDSLVDNTLGVTPNGSIEETWNSYLTLCNPRCRLECIDLDVNRTSWWLRRRSAQYPIHYLLTNNHYLLPSVGVYGNNRPIIESVEHLIEFPEIMRILLPSVQRRVKSSLHQHFAQPDTFY